MRPPDPFELAEADLAQNVLDRGGLIDHASDLRDHRGARVGKVTDEAIRVLLARGTLVQTTEGLRARHEPPGDRTGRPTS